MQRKCALVAAVLCGALAVSPQRTAGEPASTTCINNVAGTVSGASFVINACGLSPEQLAALIQALSKGNADQEHQELQRLQQQLDLTNGQLLAALTILGEKNIPLEQLPTRLVEIALQYRTLHARLAELGDSSDLARKANEALSAGDLKAAGAMLDQLIAQQEAEVKQRQAALAKSYASRAQVFNLDLNYQSAWESYQKALQYQPDDPVLLNEAGLLAYEWGRYEEAEPLFERAIAKSVPDSPDLASRLNNLAGLYQKTGKDKEAEELYKQGIAIGEKLGPDNPSQAVRLNNLGSLYRHWHRYADAEKLYRQAIAIGEKTLAPNSPEQAARFNNLGELYLGWGHFDDAEAPMLRSIEMYESLSPDNSDLIESLNNLGQLRWARQRYGEAEALYKRAIAIGEKTPSRHSELARTRINYAQLLDQLGRHDEADKQRALAGATAQ